MCIIREYSCNCPGECQSFQASNDAMERRHEDRRRSDSAWLRKYLVRASAIILVATAVGMAFLHADEVYRQQEIAEAV